MLDRPPSNKHDVEIARINRVTRIVWSVVASFSAVGVALVNALLRH